MLISESVCSRRECSTLFQLVVNAFKGGGIDCGRPVRRGRFWFGVCGGKHRSLRTAIEEVIRGLDASRGLF